MVEQKYIRRGLVIKHVARPAVVAEDGTITSEAVPEKVLQKHPSISAAKRHSSELQKAAGGHGCGILRVQR